MPVRSRYSLENKTVNAGDKLRTYQALGPCFIQKGILLTHLLSHFIDLFMSVYLANAPLLFEYVNFHNKNCEPMGGYTLQLSSYTGSPEGHLISE